MRPVILPDRMAGIDLNLEMHAILDQQHARGCIGASGVTHKAGLVFQAGRLTVLQLDHQLATLNQILGCVFVAARSQRSGTVQKVARKFNDLGTTNRVIATAFFGAVFLGDRIGAVQRVIKATPTGVGSVQCKTGVHHRNHKLGTRHGGHFRIHI